MKLFDYHRPRTIDEARALRRQGGRFYAGGTSLVDLMKCGVENPTSLVDISFLEALDTITADESRLRIGALARMSQVAGSAVVQRHCPAVSQSLSSAASQQLRNMATIGGNLMQRTRCPYFRDPAGFPACNKRDPGSGCSALGGNAPHQALFGTSDHCIATYPGDLAAVLTAFDAQVRLSGEHDRTLPIADFYRLPGDTPHLEHNLGADEMIVGIEIPLSPVALRSTYLKVRHRASYEFAAVGVAAGLTLTPDGTRIDDVRLALANVGTVPWRLHRLEEVLTGAPLDSECLLRTSLLAVEDAAPRVADGYRLKLIPQAITRALLSLAEEAQ